MITQAPLDLHAKINIQEENDHKSTPPCTISMDIGIGCQGLRSVKGQHPDRTHAAQPFCLRYTRSTFKIGCLILD